MLAPALDTVRLTLHVLAASVWVGGQIVMTGLVGPARAMGTNAPTTLAAAFAKVEAAISYDDIVGLIHAADAGADGVAKLGGAMRRRPDSEKIPTIMPMTRGN